MIMKRFVIEKTPEVIALVKRYSGCAKPYATTRDEDKAFAIVDKLSEYERILYFAVCEYGSCRRVAAFFGTNMNYASKSMKEVKTYVQQLGVAQSLTKNPTPRVQLIVPQPKKEDAQLIVQAPAPMGQLIDQQPKEISQLIDGSTPRVQLIAPQPAPRKQLIVSQPQKNTTL